MVALIIGSARKTKTLFLFLKVPKKCVYANPQKLISK